MKKLITILTLSLMFFSCSPEEIESTKVARVNIVSAFNLPTSLAVNGQPLTGSYHHGEAFDVKTNDVIEASGRQIQISINGETVSSGQGYVRYVVE